MYAMIWRRQWHPTPVLWPGKSHGQRSLVGYSPWARKESDMTERLSLSMEKQTYRTDLSTWAGEGEEGKDEMFGKRKKETYVTICKIDSQQEFAVWLKKL